jgi:hypothetical protein
MMDIGDWCYGYSNGIGPESQVALPLESADYHVDDTNVTSVKSGKKTTVIEVKSIKSAAFGIPNILSPFASIFKREGKEISTYKPTPGKPNHGSPYNPKTPPCEDRDDDYNLRKFSPVPDFLLIANGLNVTRARAFERISHRFTDYVNSVGGYVSVAALRYQKAQRYVALTDEDCQDRRLKRSELVVAGKKALGLPRYLKDVL